MLFRSPVNVDDSPHPLRITMSRTPAVPAGVIAVSVVGLVDTTFVAATPPIRSVISRLVKLVPRTVISVPPAIGPEAGVTAVMIGVFVAPVYVNAPMRVADWPSGLVTCTSRPPAVPAGVRAVSCVALTNATFVATVPPTRTVAPEVKLVPVSVIVVPPAVGPDDGVTDVMVGPAV